jgi:rRNA-processing protein EBP2
MKKKTETALAPVADVSSESDEAKADTKDTSSLEERGGGQSYFKNDSEGLIARYEDILLGSGRPIPWIERLEIITKDYAVVPSVNDDLTREAAFYEQAMQSVDRAVAAFAEQGIEWRRPDDYFAEMLKSDEHMQKVRAKLLAEKTQVEAAAERRKQREIKKYGKEVQRKRQEEKQQSKKQQLDAVKKWRQKKKMSGGDDGEEFDVNIMDGEENGANASKKRKATSVPARSSKRQHKDQKFGFGGKKRGSKKNTSDSTADMSGFGRKAHVKKGAGGPHRPGKAARQAGRKGKR